MRKTSVLLALSVIAGLSLSAAAAASKHRTKTSSSKTHLKHASASRFEPRQRFIDDARATEIQRALIKTGYLTGSPSGHWDAASITAMTKLQADNGWQTKIVPDSRALIKLGLGPSGVSDQPTAQASPASASTTASLGGAAGAAYAR